MNKILGVLVTLVAVTGFGLAACGGGGSDAPTKDEYIAQADLICRDGDEAAAKKVESTFGNQPPTQSNLTAAVEDILAPNIQKQLEDLRALTPPEGDEDTVSAIYDELESGLDKILEDPASGVQSDPFGEASRLARDYGLTECGSG